MSLDQYINIPILAVNNYVWDQFRYMAPELVASYTLDNGDEYLPFYPLGADAQTFWDVTKQENVPQYDVSEQRITSSTYSTKTVVLYDRIFRYRPQPFYQIKKEQFSYKINATENEYLEWGSALQLLLDREDDSAKDINRWNTLRQQIDPITQRPYGEKFPVFFHSMRVFAPAYAEFQQVSANDSTWVGQFIVDVQYHMTTGPYTDGAYEGQNPYDKQWVAPYIIPQTPIEDS